MITEHKMYFDLMAEVRKDPKLCSAIDKQMLRISKLEQAQAKGNHVTLEINQSYTDLLSICGWNAGIMTAVLFPKYIKGGPLSLLARPYMYAMTSLAGNTKVTFRAGRQIGKCVRGCTKLKFRDGSSCTMVELFNSI